MASKITEFNHLRTPLEEVLKATNNFDKTNIIGRGGLGKVYKGRLLRSGKWVDIAARRLNSKHKHGIEFWTEISALSSLKHENIVSIIGFCDENGEKVIINKHEAKRSLSIYLSKPTLTWIQRLRISVGVARALSYIHNGDGRGYSIIHRNINSYTILLDDNFEPTLSGFEYSMNHSVHRMDQVLISEAIGTTGYMEPSIEKIGGVTHKSDVYAFGVVLWEMLYGRKAFIPDESDRFLAPLARLHYENETLNGIIQAYLWDQMAPKSLNRFSKAAYSCTKDERVQREDMKNIVNELEEILDIQLSYENLDYRKDNLRISLEDIKLATQNFHDANCIGRGGFGNVYKGNLPKGDGFSTIVAKRLDASHGIGEKEFRNELEILIEFKHKNLISLVGYCDEHDAKIKIYEYASRGSLDRYLNDTRLTWMKRLNICIDVATALDFLHKGVGTQGTVIHRDIKSANILLNDEWNAKLADFELSLISAINLETDYVTDHRVCGTEGYVDPLYLETGFVTEESDIYSLGVVLFEIMCGREVYRIHKREDLSLRSFIKHSFESGKHDEVVFDKIKEHIMPKSLSVFQTIVYQCLHDDREERPEANEVLKQLKKAFKFQCLMENPVQHQDIGQVVNEFERSLVLELAHENPEESKNVVETPSGKNLKEITRELQTIRLSDIMLATDNFSEAKCRSQTTFYELYITTLEHFDNENLASLVKERNKSELPNRNTTIVIKRILPREYRQGEILFHREIKMLRACKHRNIVHLLGICDEDLEMILIFEDASNGYLDDYLINIKNKPILTWAKRLKICLDIANGLYYLHYEMVDQKMVINRNIKSCTIALDENLEAKIFDFGISVCLPLNQEGTIYPQDLFDGTDYYRDPDYEKTGRLTREVDVYRFGVVLLEILCGRVADDRMYIKENSKGLAYVARRYFRDGTIKKMIDPIIK